MSDFLQADSDFNETVALASYPRSGNTLMRGLIERITGVSETSRTVLSSDDALLARFLLAATRRLPERFQGHCKRTACVARV